MEENEPMTTEKLKITLNTNAGIASIVVASILVVAKLWAVFQTSSLSIAASLADSALDLMMALGALFAIRYAARPADDDHRFGHTSAEDLAALAQSLIILSSCVFITIGSISRLLREPHISMIREYRGIGVMLFSIAITIALIAYQRHIIRKTGSKIIVADSLHYIGDLIPATGTIIALIASKYFQIHQLDSIVALLAAAILARSALKIGKTALDGLMDKAAPKELVIKVQELARTTEGVIDFHDLKTRMSGSKPFIHIHIELDGDQTLREAHAICAKLEHRILQAYPSAEIIIHQDVAGEAD